MLAALAVTLVAVVAAIAAVFSPRWRPIVGRTVGWAIGGVLGLYLVGRGIAEFWVVDYSNPDSYRDAWGGPSLAGVLAVHTGPGILVVAGTAFWFWRRQHEQTRGSR